MLPPLMTTTAAILSANAISYVDDVDVDKNLYLVRYVMHQKVLMKDKCF